MAFDDDWDPEAPDDQEYFDAKEVRKHLLIIRAFDAPRYYRTENNQDGMVYPNRSRGQNFEPFPNMVVRCAVVDLDADGGPKVYPTAVLFPSSITKIAKAWVGKGPQLLMWRKGDGQTDPYELRNMRGDEDAARIGNEWLAANPEFMELKGPEPYEERAPSSNDDRGRRDDRDDRRDRRDYDDRRDRGYDDRRDRRDDGWGRDDRDRGNGGRRDSGARDWGQHDDRGRGRDDRRDDRGRSSPADDPWARDTRETRGDGSFMSRSRNAQGGFQDDEPPF